MQRDFYDLLFLWLQVKNQLYRIKLLSFPGKSDSENITIPKQIGAKYKQFGILLLEDKTEAEVDAIVTKYRDNVELINF